VAKKSAFLVIFLLTLFVDTLKYTYVSQQANINRQQAIDIAENRTFSYQQIHAKKHRSLIVLERNGKTLGELPVMSIENPVIYVPIRHLATAIVAFRSNYLPAYKAAVIYVPIRHPAGPSQILSCRQAFFGLVNVE